MKPLQELLKGKVVNCQTEEEAKEFLSFMHENGYKWMAGNSLIEKNYWDVNGMDSCYYCYVESKNLAYGRHERYVEKDKFKVITYQQFKQLINENNMETKEVKIQVPEGYEIDKENSTFDCIKFKPIKEVLTYEDVAEELFKDKKCYYTDKFGTILSSVLYDSQCLDINNCTSEKQVRKLLSINKLMNVAKYLNSKEKQSENGLWYYIRLDRNVINTDWTNPSVINYGGIHFNSREAAKQAIEILGEETIKLALSTDW